ncbi:MAG TPA: hypothetical protein DCQ06_06860 [Myxococcales bacterium]|nr:hypothetical protein [Myxococcales bacterium]
MSDWMEANWRPVVGALGALIVIWGGFGMYQQMADSSAVAAAEATSPLFETLNRPVYEAPENLQGEDPNRPRGPFFASESARADAVLAAASKAGDDPVLQLLVGAAKGRKGDWQGQLTSVDSALKGCDDPAMKLALQQQRATALSALGKKADAVTAWTEVAKGAPTKVAKAIAHIQMGDLQSPAGGAGDTGKAKAAYEAAMKVLASKEGKAPKQGAEAFYYADAKLKSAQL